MKQRYALIAPKLPPEKCGVGDYASQVAQTLTAQGHEVAVWTDSKSPARIDRVAVHSLSENCHQLFDFRPHAIFILFTPSYFYSTPRQFLPILETHLLKLKRAKIPTLLIAHELNYPVSLSPRGLLVGFPQWLHFISLCQLCDRVIFSYDSAMKKIASLAPWIAHKLFWAPVGSNIPISEPTQSWKAKLGVPEGAKWAVHFGGNHPTHRYEAMRDLIHQSNGSLHLTCIGVTQSELQKRIRTLPPQVSATGYMNAQDIAQIMTEADFMLAPYMDGISARRGTVISALANGLPVLTNSGRSTGSKIPWGQFTFLCSTADDRSFSQWAHTVLEKTFQADFKKMGVLGKEAFERYFTWERIGEKLVATAQFART